MKIEDLRTLARTAESTPYSMTGTKIQRLARAVLAGIVEADRHRNGFGDAPMDGTEALAEAILRAMEDAT